MNELAKDWFKGIETSNGMRGRIAAYASEVSKMPAVTQILRHHFGEKLYARESFRPGGTYSVGKIHRHQTLNLVLLGQIAITMEDGTQKVYQAPEVFFSGPGTVKASYAITDCIIMNVHALDQTTTDLDSIEKELICSSYEEMESEWEAMGGRPECLAIQTTEVVEGDI